MKTNKSEMLRALWPRVTRLILNDKPIITVDGRPTHRRKYFKQPEEALAYAQELADFKASEVEEPLLFSSRLRVIASDGEKALRAVGSSLAEAIDFYLAYLEKKRQDGPGISMHEAIGQYIAARLKEFENGQITKVTYDSLRHRVKRDQAYFDKVLVKDVSPTMIMTYLEHGELGPKTRRNVKVRLSHIFTFCRMKGWIESNPCSLISIKVPHRDVEIFTIEETTDLMRECWYSDYAAVLIPFAAVCFFAGLRPKEAERLRWEFIDFKTKHIEITSATSKVRDTRFVHMEPNLIEWLKPYQQTTGLILGSTGSRKAWDNARAAVGWITRGRGTKPWIADGMRHSYASYWLAVHRNRAELTELMGNSPEIIRVHYRRPVLAAIAKKYWEITPETVCQKA